MHVTQHNRDGALDLLKWLALLSMVLDHLRYVGYSVDCCMCRGGWRFRGFVWQWRPIWRDAWKSRRHSGAIWAGCCCSGGERNSLPDVHS